MLFSEKIVTETVTVRDCMSRTSGLPDNVGNQTLNYGYDKNFIYDTFQYYQNVGFRTNFHYTDMALPLGFEKAANTLGKSMCGALREFFSDVGMDNTYCSPQEYKDIAAIQYSPSGVPHRTTVQYPPMGGIGSTNNDMEVYLRLHLNPKSKCFARNLQEIYKIVVASPPPNDKYYGIGTVINSYIPVKNTSGEKKKLLMRISSIIIPVCWKRVFPPLFFMMFGMV